MAWSFVSSQIEKNRNSSSNCCLKQTSPTQVFFFFIIFKWIRHELHCHDAKMLHKALQEANLSEAKVWPWCRVLPFLWPVARCSGERSTSREVCVTGQWEGTSAVFTTSVQQPGSKVTQRSCFRPDAPGGGDIYIYIYIYLVSSAEAKRRKEREWRLISCEKN